jgi:hypothetical protein
MDHFIISVFRNFPSSPTLNKFYWPTLIWSSHPLHFYLHFAWRRRWIVFRAMGSDFQGLGLQLPKFGRITVLLGLCATAQYRKEDQCLNYYIYSFYVLILCLIWNSRVSVNTSFYSIEHEVHDMNIQLLYNSDKAEPTQYNQYINL